jgi:HSP20 family protein
MLDQDLSGIPHQTCLGVPIMNNEVTTQNQNQNQSQSGTETAERRVLRPLADIVEFADRYQIVADLPGVSEDAVDISLDRNILTIRAHATQAQPEDMRPVWREYEPVDYERRFTLGHGIEHERIDASMRNGVLTLVLPKGEKQQPRRINVSNGG